MPALSQGNEQFGNGKARPAKNWASGQCPAFIRLLPMTGTKGRTGNPITCPPANILVPKLYGKLLRCYPSLIAQVPCVLDKKTRLDISPGD